MGKLEILYRKTNELIPYARNARTHSPEQVQQIAGSIREFGFTSPVLIDEDGGIIAGHGRVMAAQLLDLESVPTITLTGLSETQKRAYIIADNKLALNAGWDLDRLEVEMQDLYKECFDLSLTGFDLSELDELGVNLEDIESDDENEDVFDSVGENPSPSVQIEYLSFGKYKIPLSNDELNSLESKLEQYTDSYSGTFGFATYLIGDE